MGAAVGLGWMRWIPTFEAPTSPVFNGISKNYGSSRTGEYSTDEGGDTRSNRGTRHQLRPGGDELRVRLDAMVLIGA
jgi:hypothetical protein